MLGHRPNPWQHIIMVIGSTLNCGFHIYSTLIHILVQNDRMVDRILWTSTLVEIHLKNPAQVIRSMSPYLIWIQCLFCHNKIILFYIFKLCTVSLLLWYEQVFSLPYFKIIQFNSVISVYINHSLKYSPALFSVSTVCSLLSVATLPGEVIENLTPVVVT